VRRFFVGWLFVRWLFVRWFSVRWLFVMKFFAGFAIYNDFDFAAFHDFTCVHFQQKNGCLIQARLSLPNRFDLLSVKEYTKAAFSMPP